MYKRKVNNRYSGIYRTSDSIENLHIRVTLKKLYSTIQIPKFDAIQNLSLAAATSGEQQSVDFQEVIELKWQQKVFSKTELSYYKLTENCQNDTEKKYHQAVKALPESHEAGILFTYTHNDKFKPPDNFGPKDVKISKLRKSVEEIIETSTGTSGLFVDPSLKIIPSRYKDSNDFENFFIMADLEPATLLFTLKYRKPVLFLIYPDFNEPSNPYHLEIDQDSKQIYSFHIENLSTVAINNEALEKAKQKQKLDELHSETQELMQKMKLSTRDENFFYPKFCRIILMLEIVSGSDFEFDNIHVRYEFKVPKFVKIVEGIAEASTHSSFASENVWNFGHCHSLILDIDDEFMISSTQMDLIEINFEVISVDSLWGRERREGLATLKIPLESSKSVLDVELNCFRELQGGSWIKDFLERYFLGGIRNSRLSGNGGNNLYGNKTVSTGSLKVKLQQIRQVKTSQRHNLKMQTIEEIINCYHKAKAKLG